MAHAKSQRWGASIGAVAGIGAALMLAGCAGSSTQWVEAPLIADAQLSSNAYVGYGDTLSIASDSTALLRFSLATLPGANAKKITVDPKGNPYEDRAVVGDSDYALSADKIKHARLVVFADQIDVPGKIWIRRAPTRRGCIGRVEPSAPPACAEEYPLVTGANADTPAEDLIVTGRGYYSFDVTEAVKGGFDAQTLTFKVGGSGNARFRIASKDQNNGQNDVERSAHLLITVADLRGTSLPVQKTNAIRASAPDTSNADAASLAVSGGQRAIALVGLPAEFLAQANTRLDPGLVRSVAVQATLTTRINAPIASAQTIDAQAPGLWFFPLGAQDRSNATWNNTSPSLPADARASALVSTPLDLDPAASSQVVLSDASALLTNLLADTANAWEKLPGHYWFGVDTNLAGAAMLDGGGNTAAAHPPRMIVVRDLGAGHQINGFLDEGTHTLWASWKQFDFTSPVSEIRVRVGQRLPAFYLTNMLAKEDGNTLSGNTVAIPLHLWVPAAGPRAHFARTDYDTIDYVNYGTTSPPQAVAIDDVVANDIPGAYPVVVSMRGHNHRLTLNFINLPLPGVELAGPAQVSMPDGASRVTWPVSAALPFILRVTDAQNADVPASGIVDTMIDWRFTSSNPADVVPDDVHRGGGSHPFAVTFNGAGRRSLTATSKGNAAIRATLDVVVVNRPALVVNNAGDTPATATPENCAAGNADTCRLRDAIALAASGDTITFAPQITRIQAQDQFTFGHADADANALPITLDGAGKVAIDGAAIGFPTNPGMRMGSRVFETLAGTKTVLSGLSIRNGFVHWLAADGGVGGGGILNRGTLRILRCTIEGNKAERGGGINNYFNADLTIAASTLMNNNAGNGGAILSSGRLALINNTIANNRADPANTYLGDGGSGGGLFSTAATALLVNNTFSGNLARTDTNSGGFNGAGVALSGTQLTLANNLFDNGANGSNACKIYNDNAITDQGGNVAADASCALTAASSRSSTPLNLGVLQNNGGPTQTMLPAAASAAVDAGVDGACNDAATVGQFDQRGVARPQGAHCDAGSVELKQVQLSVTASGSGSVTAATTPAPISGGIVACSNATCSAHYDSAAAPLVALNAAPAPDHRVVWTGTCTVNAGNPLQASITMDAAKRCTATFEPAAFTLGGTASGHAGVVALRLNSSNPAGAPQTISVAAGTTAFAFATALPYGSNWSIEVVSAPAGQACSISPASGTVLAANVTDLVLSCTTVLVTIEPAALQAGIYAAAYPATQFGASSANGGTAPYAFAVGGGLPPGMTLTSSGVLSGTPSAAGSYTLIVNATSSNGYSGSRSYPLSIDKAAQVLVFSAPPAIAVGATGTVLATSVLASNSGNAVQYSAAPANICTVSGATLTGVARGSCVVTATQAGDANYFAASAMQTIGIGAASQTIAFAPQDPAVRTYEQNGLHQINPLARASSDLPVTYSSMTPNVCSVTGTTWTMLAVGTCTIAADQAGDANTNAAARVTQSVTITAAPLVPTTLSLRATPNPVTRGQMLTLTATVGSNAPASAFLPTAREGKQELAPAAAPIGMITFLDSGTPIGSAALNACGVTTFTIAQLSVGAHAISASYAGDGTYAAAIGGPVNVVVDAQAVPTPTVPAPMLSWWVLLALAGALACAGAYRVRDINGGG